MTDVTEPTPSEMALSAEEEKKFRESVAAIDRSVGDDDYSLQWSNRVARRLLATLDRERLVTQEMWRRESAVSRSLRASRSATEESLRAALDECRQHHADTLAGNERGQHGSVTEGREVPNDGRCAAQAETIHGWVQCVKPPFHEDRHVWGDDNRVTPAEPFA